MNGLLGQLTPRIDALLAKNGRASVAIDGNSGAGKTTLAAALAAHYGELARVLHADDYFLQPSARTPERLKEPGGNFDRERFLQEVARPVSRFAPVQTRRFDCGAGSLGEPVCMPFRPLTVVEGSYCLHPALGNYCDLSVCLCIPEALQRRRILARDPERAERFLCEWIPMENAYLAAHAIRERCDLVLHMEHD